MSDLSINLVESVNKKFSEYLSEDVKKEMCHVVKSTVNRKIGNRYLPYMPSLSKKVDLRDVYKVQYLGITIHQDQSLSLVDKEKIFNNKLEKLANVYSECVKNKFIFYGELMPCSKMQLVSIDSGGNLISKNGYVLNKEYEEIIKKPVLPIFERYMLLIFPLAKLDRLVLNEELNKILKTENIQYFQLEGGLPEIW